MINKYLIKYYIKFVSSFGRRRYKIPKVPDRRIIIEKIAIVYSIPKDSPRFTTWNDGFVAAVNLLDPTYNITWVNIETNEITEDFLNSFDFLIVKSNWNWGPD